MIHALLPAGGRSVRMGQPKLLLPLGPRTVLEQVIAALYQAGLERILVVVAPHLPELAVIAQSAGADTLLLSDATPDMRATVEAGLAWIERQWTPQPDDAWLLVPADHPTLEPDVIRVLIVARDQDQDASIFIPTVNGQRGHPTLIGWSHVPAIRAFPVEHGLNRYLRTQAAFTREVAVENEQILWDLDTPEDYERLKRLFRLQ